SFISNRIVSVIATTLFLFILYKVLRKETKSIFWAISGIGLYLAAYVKTGLFLLVARIDPLFIFLLASSMVSVYYSKTILSIVLAGLIFSACYFTKQTALFFLPGMVFYLWKERSLKNALIFSLACTL